VEILALQVAILRLELFCQHLVVYLEAQAELITHQVVLAQALWE
jgi:hypothetical protein